MKKKVVIATLLALLSLGALVPSHAGEVTYVSGPGEQFKGYTVPALVLPQGTTLTYLNVDIARHNFVAEGALGTDRPWCALGGFQPGQCPLFWSPDAPLAGQVRVYGMEDVTPGTYTFRCLYHAAQRGTLVVV